MKYYERIIPLLLLLTGLYLVPLSIMKTDLSMIPGDLGDARFNNYILEHGHLYFTGKLNEFWNAPFFYPTPNIIAYSDNLLGTLPLYSIFRILNFSRETSFQFYILVIFILNFLCCYWVLNRWIKNTIIASCGAYIFAFSIYLLGHITNIQVLPKFIIPFIFFWGWTYLHTKKITYFILINLGIVYQFYCSMYMGFFVIYSMFFYFVTYFLIYKDKLLFSQFKSSKIILHHVLIIFTAGVLLLPLALPYLEVSKIVGPRGYQDILSTLPTIQSYFLSIPSSLIWSSIFQNYLAIENWWCHTLFMGVTVWLSILVLPFILTSKKINLLSKKTMLFLSLTLFLNILFTLKIHDFTLYYIIYLLPGFDSLRALNRIINVEIIFFVFIFAFVITELHNINKKVKYLLIILPAFIVVDNFLVAEKVPRFNKLHSQNRVNLIRDEILQQDSLLIKPIAYIHNSKSDNLFELYIDIMIASQDLNIKSVNGYSGSTPKNLINFYNDGTVNSLQEWCDYNKLNISEISLINSNKSNLFTNDIIHFKSYNGNYICSDRSNNNLLIANRSIPGEWESFIFKKINGTQCYIVTHDGYYVSYSTNKKNNLSANSMIPINDDKFEIIKFSENSFAIKTFDGKFVSVDSINNELNANSYNSGRFETFTIAN